MKQRLQLQSELKPQGASKTKQKAKPVELEGDFLKKSKVTEF
jgi:hypothetical protein